MNKKQNTEDAKKKLDTISRDINNVIGCLESLENSLYFAEERKDKDITKPCAKCVEMITLIISNCQEAVEDVIEALEG